MKAYFWDAIAVIGMALVSWGLAEIWGPLALLWVGGLTMFIGIRGPVVTATSAKEKEKVE